MSRWLELPGWLIGSPVCAAILMVALPPLLRASRVRHRIATLGGPHPEPAGAAPPRAAAAATGPVPGRSDPARLASGRRRHLVLLATATTGAALVSPVLAVGMAALGWMWPRWRATAAARRHDLAAARELPEVVDLFLVASASGLNLPLALGAVGERGPPLLGAALRRTAADVADGARLADAIDAGLGPIGDPARPLAAALLGAARYGAALGPALDRLAIETRQLRRRQAEEAIRRVPIKLLFPLVLLVLPAFVLLTVVPLLAGALRSLPL